MVAQLNPRELAVFDLASGKQRAVLQNTKGLRWAGFSPDGQEVAVNYGLNDLELCDSTTGKVHTHLAPPRIEIEKAPIVYYEPNVVYSHDGRFLVAGRQEVHVWKRE